MRRSRPEHSGHTRHGLRLVKGEGKKKTEALNSRDAVARVLLEAGIDLLLRRITVERAEHIERSVSRILHLFDVAEAEPEQWALLQKQLEALELLMKESREKRRPALRRGQRR